MSRKYKKYSKEFKLQAVRDCEEGATFYSVDKKYGLSFGTTGKWFAYYKAQGEDALEKHNMKITGSPVAPVRTLGSMIPDNWEALFRS